MRRKVAAMERSVLVCAPVETVDNPVDGSVTGTCHQCRTDVWIAPSGQSKLGPGVLVACVSCAVGMAATEPTPPVVEPVTADTRAELRARGVTDADIALRMRATRHLLGRRGRPMR